MKNFLASIALLAIIGAAATQAQLAQNSQAPSGSLTNAIRQATNTLANFFREKTENVFGLFDSQIENSGAFESSKGRVSNAIFGAPAPCPITPGAQDVIAAAEREIGIKEFASRNGAFYCPTSLGGGGTNRGDNSCKDPGSQAIGSVDDYQGFLGSARGYPWCSAFVAWVFDRAGHPLGSCARGFVYQMVDCAKAKGWDVDGVPAPGDIAIWNYNAGVNSDDDHTGIVTGVRFEAGSMIVETIEGNGQRGSIAHKVQRDEVVNSSAMLYIAVPGVGVAKGDVCRGSAGGGIPPGYPDNPSNPHDPNAITDPTYLPTYKPPPRKHTECRKRSCVIVDGPGINQCGNGADCKTSHTTCFGGQCIRVPEPGQDECVPKTNKIIGSTDRTCHDLIPTRSVNPGLGIGTDCVTVPGSGKDECQTKHTTCFGNQCIIVYEPGVDECILADPDNPNDPDNNDLIGFPGKCPMSTHRECVGSGLGKRCAVVPGPGADTCTSDVKCEEPPPPPDVPECTAKCIDKDTCLNRPNCQRIEGNCNTPFLNGGVCCLCIDQPPYITP